MLSRVIFFLRLLKGGGGLKRPRDPPSFPPAKKVGNNILKSRIFDVVSLNETKLDKSYPNSFYSNNDYLIIRKDKSRREKGLIVFIRKEYEVIKIDLGETEEIDIDYIYFQLIFHDYHLQFQLMYHHSYIQYLILIYLSNVTRFGEISSLWQHFNRLWENFDMVLIWYLVNF